VSKDKLTGLKKIAILLISLGPDLSSKILKHFREEEIEKISSEIANISVVDSDVRKKVIDEFLALYEAQSYIEAGGLKYAREILERTLGPQKANEMLKRLTEASRIKPFNLLRKADPKQLINFINNEHPQTISLILSYLQPEQAAVVLSSLPEGLQTEITKRIATMERTSPEMLREVEAVLEKKLSSVVNQDFTVAGGIDTLVDILNRVDRGTEKSILEDLERDDQELVEEIRKRMFVFEDIITLDDQSIRRVLREIDFKDLAYALKGSSNEVSDRILKNLSKRAGEMLM
jgi:flagellar motor switch protein FliG